MSRPTTHEAARDHGPPAELIASLGALPIFPLPNAVLLPGGVLPLHVFEPRYREMVQDCLSGSRTMAVALLKPGYEIDYEGRPPVYPICGVGTIVASEELPDGRFHLLLRGQARARIEEELAPERAYRRVQARLLDAEAARDRVAAEIGHRQLLALCDRLAISLGQCGQALCELVHAQTSAGACADVIASALVTVPRLRQALLETLDAGERVDAVVDLVSRIVCQLTPSDVVN